MFGIFIEGKPAKPFGELAQPATIVIDDFFETLYLPLTYWNIDNYKKSWFESLKQGMKKGTHSTLITTMSEPKFTNFIFTWILYFEKNKVYIQNKILFLEEITNFNPAKINDYRTTYDEDGNKISEWHTDLSSVLTFYEMLEKEINSSSN